MAVTATHLDGGAAASSPTGIITASVSPGANRLVLLLIDIHRGSSSQPANPSSVSGCSLTWVQVGTKIDYDIGGTSRGSLFLYRALGASPTTGAITVTFGYTAQNFSYELDEFDNVDTSGTNGSGAVVQAGQNNGSSSSTASVTLSAFGDAGNATYGGAGGEEQEHASSPEGTGFTLLGTNKNFSTVWCTTISDFRNDNDTTPDADFVGNTQWGIYGVEIKAAVAGAINVGQATETDTAQPILFTQFISVGQATETDTAQTVAPVAPGVITAVHHTGGTTNLGGVSGTITTASATPTADALQLLIINVQGLSFNPDVNQIGVSGCGLTWTLLDSENYDSSGSQRQTGLLFSAIGSTPTTGALTITFSSFNLYGISYEWDELRNVDPRNPIVQNLSTPGTGTTPLATLSAFASSDNGTYGASCSEANAGGTPPGSGFTELGHHQVAGHGSVIVATISEFRDTNDTTVDASLGTSQPWAMFALEAAAYKDYGDVGQATETETAQPLQPPTTTLSFEPFNKADSRTIGPNLTWTKFDIDNGGDPWGAGADDGVVYSETFALDGGDRTGLSTPAQWSEEIIRAEVDVGTNRMFVQADIAALLRTGEHYPEFALIASMDPSIGAGVTPYGPSGVYFWYEPNFVSNLSFPWGTVYLWDSVTQTAWYVSTGDGAYGHFLIPFMPQIGDSIRFEFDPPMGAFAIRYKQVFSPSFVTVTEQTFSYDGLTDLPIFGERGGLGIVSTWNAAPVDLVPYSDRLDNFVVGPLTAVDGTLPTQIVLVGQAT